MLHSSTFDLVMIDQRLMSLKGSTEIDILYDGPPGINIYNCPIALGQQKLGLDVIMFEKYNIYCSIYKQVILGIFNASKIASIEPGWTLTLFLKVHKVLFIGCRGLFRMDKALFNLDL